MIEKKHEIETNYLVYFAGEPRHMIVRPDQDGLGTVEVLTGKDKESKDWFGDVRFNADSAFMRKLAEAIVRCADDLDRGKDAE